MTYEEILNELKERGWIITHHAPTEENQYITARYEKNQSPRMADLIFIFDGAEKPVKLANEYLRKGEINCKHYDMSYEELHTWLEKHYTL